MHRGNIDNPAFLSGWELRPDPADPNKLKPVQLPVLQEPGVSYEGLDAGNGHIYVAQRQKGLAIYKRDADKGFARVGTFTELNNAWGVRVRGTTAFVSDGLAGLAIVDVADPAKPKLVGRVATGGQARGLALDRNTAYVAAGSAGLVIVDISRLAAPRVIGRAETPGSAVRVDYSGGRAYVAAWNDARVYDVADAIEAALHRRRADDAQPRWRRQSPARHLAHARDRRRRRRDVRRQLAPDLFVPRRSPTAPPPASRCPRRST